MEDANGFEDNAVLQIVPEEMWKHIFGYLNDPSDLKNVTKVSGEFDIFLQTRKASFLFPDAVQVLIKKEYLGATQVLNCRLLNTHIKRAVDSTLELLPKHFKSFTEMNFTASLKTQSNWDVVQSFEQLETSVVLRLYNRTPENVRHIMENIQASDEYYRLSNGSPFASRHIFFEERSELRASIALRTVFQRQVMTKEFLDVAGKYFWHCDMRSHSHGFFTLPAWYLGIVELIKRMPNLKTLLFHYPWTNNGYSKMELKQLYELLSDHPFPNLPELNVLVIKHVPGCVVSAVLEANKHVKTLKLEESSSEIGLCDSLENLSIQVPSSSEFQLCAAGEDWRLGKLELLFAFAAGNITGREVFDFLELHKEYLTHLQLRLPLVCDMSVGKTGMLQLPKLVELRLIMTFNTDIDFISELSSLKNLYIQMNHPAEKPKKVARNINFDDTYFDRMLESNIWKVRPTLNYIEFTVVTTEPPNKLHMETYNYSRAEYKLYTTASVSQRSLD